MIEYKSNYYDWRTLKTYNASILQRFEEMEYIVKIDGIEMNAVNNGSLNPLLVEAFYKQMMWEKLSD